MPLWSEKFCPHTHISEAGVWYIYDWIKARLKQNVLTEMTKQITSKNFDVLSWSFILFNKYGFNYI